MEKIFQLMCISENLWCFVGFSISVNDKASSRTKDGVIGEFGDKNDSIKEVIGRYSQINYIVPIIIFVKLALK